VQTLFLLAAVVVSQPLSLHLSAPAHLEPVASLTLPGSQSGKLYLLEPGLKERRDDDGTTARVIVECAVGFGGEAVGVIVGSLAFSDSPKLEEAIVPLSLLVLGSSLGVSLTGWAMDGRGQFGYALLGSVIGLVVPMLAGLGLLLAEGCNPDTLTNCGALVPMAIGMLLLPPVGATIGYELSAPTPWLSLGYASRPPPPEPRVVPVVTLAREGLGITLGLAGRL
jgi:hypothetical protein